MKTISATDAKVRFAALLDDAKREPVLIRNHNRDVAIIMSPLDYARLTGTNYEEQAERRAWFDQLRRDARAKRGEEE